MRPRAPISAGNEVPMDKAQQRWWDGLSIQKKVWAVLLLVIVPMIGALASHIWLVNQLLATQQIRHDSILAREQTQVLRRLTVDIEDAFRGYLLTRNRAFLTPMTDAEQKLDGAVAEAIARLRRVPQVSADLTAVGARLRELLASKHVLLARIERGETSEVLKYVSSGEGLALSDHLRTELRLSEDRLEQHIDELEREAVKLSTKTYWGLVAMVCLGIGLGIAGVRLLTRSLTEPLGSMRVALWQVGKGEHEAGAAALQSVRSGDEIGQLARSCEEMITRIREPAR